jgi:hypothetical protein
MLDRELAVWVLSTIAKDLALPLSKLEEEKRPEKLPLDRNEYRLKLQQVMGELTEQNLVRATPSDHDTVYAITADGVRALERTGKRGFFGKLAV